MENGFDTPISAYPSFHTESEVASSRLSSHPTLEHLSNLILRCFALLLSLLAAVALAVAGYPSPSKRCLEFPRSATYRYSISVAVIGSIYSFFQLFKGVCDIAFLGFLVPEKIFDYATFALDQVAAYLFLSSSSALVPEAHHLATFSCGRLGAVAVGMSLCAFLVLAISTLQSGYKLCKRIIW